ncbi:hypothetical protein LEMLEM_LOCUS23839, partial [Lemmus lemmus]
HWLQHLEHNNYVKPQKLCLFAQDLSKIKSLKLLTPLEDLLAFDGCGLRENQSPLWMWFMAARLSDEYVSEE